MELFLARSLTSGAELPRHTCWGSIGTEHRSVCLSGAAYQSTGIIWASTFSPFLVQAEAQNIPTLVHQHQL